MFWFRNNVAHGRTHGEISGFGAGTENKLRIESGNQNYEMVRDYLIENKMMKVPNISNNVDFLWRQTKKFLQAVIDGNESTFKQRILSEWNTVNQA